MATLKVTDLATELFYQAIKFEMPGINLPKVPEGLRELMKSLTKEVLREKPQNLYEFSANYFDSMVEDKRDFVFKGYEPVSTAKNWQRHPVPLSLVYSIIPAELTALIKEFIKAVLKANPPNICEFAVDYFRGNLAKSDVSTHTIQYNAYDNYVMNKSFSTNIKCVCGRSFGDTLVTDTGDDINESASDIASRNSTAEATHETKHFSFIDKHKEEPNIKVAQTLPVLYGTEKYIKATYVIQQHFRRYLLTKRNQNTNISEEAAAIIIQRTLRKLFMKRHLDPLSKQAAVNQKETPEAGETNDFTLNETPSTNPVPGIKSMPSADVAETETAVPIEAEKQPKISEIATNNAQYPLHEQELALASTYESDSNSPEIKDDIGRSSEYSERSKRSIDAASDIPAIVDHSSQPKMYQTTFEPLAVTGACLQIQETNSSVPLDSSGGGATVIEDDKQTLGHQESPEIGNETSNLQKLLADNFEGKSIDFTLDDNTSDAEKNDTYSELIIDSKEEPQNIDQAVGSRTDDTIEIDEMKTNSEDAIKNTIETLDSTSNLDSTGTNANQPNLMKEVIPSSPELVEAIEFSPNMSSQNDTTDKDLMMDEYKNAETKNDVCGSSSKASTTPNINCGNTENNVQNINIDSKNSSNEEYDASPQYIVTTRDGIISENELNHLKQQNSQNSDSSSKNNNELVLEKESSSLSSNDEKPHKSRNQISEKGASNKIDLGSKSTTNLDSKEKILEIPVSDWNTENIEESVISSITSSTNDNIRSAVHEMSSATQRNEDAPHLTPTSHETKISGLDLTSQVGEEDVAVSKSNAQVIDAVIIGVPTKGLTDSSIQEYPHLQTVPGDCQDSNSDITEANPSPEVTTNSQELLETFDPDTPNNDNLIMSLERALRHDENGCSPSDTGPRPDVSNEHSVLVANDDSIPKATIVNEGNILQTPDENDEEVDSKSPLAPEELGNNVHENTDDSSSNLQNEDDTISAENKEEVIQNDDTSILNEMNVEQHNEIQNDSNPVGSPAENDPSEINSENPKNVDTVSKNVSEPAINVAARTVENVSSLEKSEQSIGTKTQNENTKFGTRLNEVTDIPRNETVSDEEKLSQSVNTEDVETAEVAVGSTTLTSASTFGNNVEPGANVDSLNEIGNNTLEPKNGNHSNAFDINFAPTQDTTDPSGIAISEEHISGAQRLSVDSGPKMESNDNINVTCLEQMDAEIICPIDNGNLSHPSTQNDAAPEQCKDSNEKKSAINEQIIAEASDSNEDVAPIVDSQDTPFSELVSVSDSISNQSEQATATDPITLSTNEEHNAALEDDKILTSKSNECANIADGNVEQTELEMNSIRNENQDVNTFTSPKSSNDVQTTETEYSVTNPINFDEKIEHNVTSGSLQNIEDSSRGLTEDISNLSTHSSTENANVVTTTMPSDSICKPENQDGAVTQSMVSSALDNKITPNENHEDASDIEIAAITSRSKRSIDGDNKNATSDIEPLSPTPIGTQNSHRRTVVEESIGITNFPHQILKRDGSIATELDDKTQQRIMPTNFLETYPNQASAEVYSAEFSNYSKESVTLAKKECSGKMGHLNNYSENSAKTCSKESTSKSPSYPERAATYLYGVHIHKETSAHPSSVYKRSVTFFVPIERRVQNRGKTRNSANKKSDGVALNSTNKSIPRCGNEFYLKESKNLKVQLSNALPQSISGNGEHNGTDNQETTSYELESEIATESSSSTDSREPLAALDTIFEINESEACSSDWSHEKESNTLQKSSLNNSKHLPVSHAVLQEISCDAFATEMVSQTVCNQESNEWQSPKVINEEQYVEDFVLFTHASVKIQKWFRRYLITTRTWKLESDAHRKHFYQCGNKIGCADCLVQQKSATVLQRAFRRYLSHKQMQMCSLNKSDVTDLVAGMSVFEQESSLDMSAQTDSSSLQSQDTAIFNGSYSEKLCLRNENEDYSSLQTSESTYVLADPESQCTFKNWFIGNEPIETTKFNNFCISDTEVNHNLKTNCPAPTSLKFTTIFDENTYCNNELNYSDEIISADNISERVTQTQYSKTEQSNDLAITDAEGKSDRGESDVVNNNERTCITGNLYKTGDGNETAEEGGKEIMVPAFDTNKNNIIVAISEFLKHEKSFCESCEEDPGNLCPDKLHEEIDALQIPSNKRIFSQADTKSLKSCNEQESKDNKLEHEFDMESLSDESLSNVTEKLQETNRTIEKMQQRRASEASINSIEEQQARMKESNFEEPDIRPLKALESSISQPSDEEEVIVSRLQRDETRESSGQSDSVVFGQKCETKEAGGAKKPLQRLHTVAVSDSKTLLKSVTIDETIKYIEPCETETTSTSGNSFCLDDDTSENIRQKMMAYSLSEADSDYFHPADSEMGVSMDKTKIYFDDFNISTALGDTVGTSTDTESTIVPAVTKIQAGGRRYLTKKRLPGSSTRSSSQGESKASFGNEAINESLEQLIEEEAAKKIQKAYRRHFKQSRTVDYEKASHDFDSIDSGSFPTTSRENSLAARRLTLQRGDALRNDSNPDEEAGGTDGKERDEKKYLASVSDIKKGGLDASTVAGAGTAKAIRRSDYSLKWFAMRQNSMPVQIESEILRVIPKHMRKRIKSAEGVQKARRNHPKD